MKDLSVSESLEGFVKTDPWTPPPNIHIQVVLGRGREFAFPTNSRGCSCCYSRGHQLGTTDPVDLFPRIFHTNLIG